MISSGMPKFALFIAAYPTPALRARRDVEALPTVGACWYGTDQQAQTFHFGAQGRDALDVCRMGFHMVQPTGRALASRVAGSPASALGAASVGFAGASVIIINWHGRISVMCSRC